VGVWCGPSLSIKHQKIMDGSHILEPGGLMETNISLQQIDAAVAAIRARINCNPRIGIILGSGLGGLADQVQDATIVPVAELPDWPASTVMGHQGRLVVGSLAGQPVIVLQGRIHYYEGYSMAQVTMPVRVMHRLGVEILVVTNAAGAIRAEFQPGDVMLITDHINMIGLGGENPLRGPNLVEFGERFPDMSRAYDRDLAELARAAAVEAEINLHEGVYVGLPGPSFETPAELRFLSAVGSDAVGMSTVGEVVAARHSKIRVLGFSGISNKANLDGNSITTHAEVLEAGGLITPRLTALIMGVLKKL
jgi:purine-nucleoside phosphorylase